MEQSHDRAAEQICGHTSKKRGSSATLPRAMETRAAKKARLDSLVSAVTPVMSNNSRSLGDPSLSLMSPPNSDLSPTTSSPIEGRLQYQQSHQAAVSDNILSITFTSPPTLSSFRALSAQQGPPDLPETSSLPITHVGQNHNSTWFIDSTPAFFTQKSDIESAVQETHLSGSLKPKSQATYHDDFSDDDGPSLQAHPHCSSRKKKPDDDDLSFHEKPSSPEPMEEAEGSLQKKPSSKRKSTSTVTTRFKNSKLSSYHENVQEGRPDPIGGPEVWAFKRQQLCETLPYYNAYQSGAYTQDGIARSILIDKEVSIRDKFNDEVVITSV
jgi:hypothetical protein